MFIFDSYNIITLIQNIKEYIIDEIKEKINKF